MMVVVFHIGTQANRLGYTGTWPVWPSTGVDVFFVISGFVMWTTTRARHSGTIDFYKRRLARIVPLYWLLTGLSVALMLGAPGVVKSNRFDINHVVASFLFSPAPNPVTGALEPVLAPGWTLNYEMFFYAAFGAMLLLPARRRFTAMGAVLMTALLLGAMFPNQVVFRFFGVSIILEFWFGMALGVAFLRGWVMASGLAWASVVIGFLALALGVELAAPRALVSGLPALAIVAGCLSLEALFRLHRLRVLQLLGDASYSLYLSHGIVLSAAGQVALLLGLARLPGIVPIFVVAGVVTASLVAVVIHRAVELPLARLFAVRKRPFATSIIAE